MRLDSFVAFPLCAGPFMAFRVEKILALRYLRSRRREGFISVISGFSMVGIALGVATLIIVLSVMNGFRKELLGRVLGLNGHVNIYGRNAVLGDFDPLLERIRSVSSVTHAYPMVEGQVLITIKGNTSGAMIRGMRPADMADKPVLGKASVGGDWVTISGDQVAIGARMAGRLGLALGDHMTLVSPKGTVTPFGTIPVTKSFEVALVFDSGMYEYDNNFIFMPLDTAQNFMKLDRAVTAIEIYVAQPDQVERADADITQVIAGAGRITDWKKMNGSFFTALEVERNVMFLILTLIILVAAFNIISGMIMLIKDKTGDIAILRTMGASRGLILRAFLLTGASLGMIGTLAGFILGLAITLNLSKIQHWLEAITGAKLWDPTIRFLTQIPSEIDWGEVVLVVTISLALTLLAAMIPAWRAARIDPVEALRYE